jgi:hypothetical protein
MKWRGDLERRKIEAGVLIPMVQAFQRAFGKEQAAAVAREVIVELARRDGEQWANQFGGDLPAMEKVSQLWAAGGSLDLEQLEDRQSALSSTSPGVGMRSSTKNWACRS